MIVRGSDMAIGLVSQNISPTGMGVSDVVPDLRFKMPSAARAASESHLANHSGSSMLGVACAQWT